MRPLLKSPVELHRLCRPFEPFWLLALVIGGTRFVTGKGVARGEGEGIGETLLEL